MNLLLFFIFKTRRKILSFIFKYNDYKTLLLVEHFKKENNCGRVLKINKEC